MKSLKALAIGLLLISQTVMAQDVFTYSRPILVQQSDTGAYCPQVVNVTAVNERGSLQGRAVSVVTTKGDNGVFTFSFTDHQCISDMICLTEHHYTKQGVMVEVKLRLNNDGAYPTTNLPGYSAFGIDFLQAGSTQRKSCLYLLN